MPDPAALALLARSLFPPGVEVAGADPRLSPAPLLPGETPGRAVDKRHREFAAGRVAARAAMQALGLPEVPIPMGADRAPQWPAGVIGSISHSDSACLAAVALAPSVVGIGLDVEVDGHLDPDVWDTILSAEEQMDLPHIAPGAQALLVFSAKEAAYKAQYTLTRTMIDFQSLRIRVAPTSFTVEWQIGLGPFRMGAVMEGRYLRAEGHLVTAVTL